jgi:hypothetical protein
MTLSMVTVARKGYGDRHGSGQESIFKGSFAIQMRIVNVQSWTWMSFFKTHYRLARIVTESVLMLDCMAMMTLFISWPWPHRSIIRGSLRVRFGSTFVASFCLALFSG